MTEQKKWSVPEHLLELPQQPDLFFRTKKKKKALPPSYFKVTGMWTFCFIDLNLILVDIKKRMPMEIGFTTTERRGQGGRSNHQARD